jgi:GntR family transcriptional regulator
MIEPRPIDLKIDSESGLPLHKQIENAFRQKIDDLELKVGELIPSEKELEKILGVSRSPVRQAIGRLVHDGYLVRKSGKGTFVSQAHIMRRQLPRLNSFTEEMQAQGMGTSARVLNVEFIEKNSLNKWIFKRLQDDRILEVSRLRLVNGKPVCILQSYFPARIGVRDDDDYTGSLYELLERKFKIKIGSGEEKISALMANPHQAKLLEIPNVSAILSIQRTTLSTNHEPIEIVNGFYRADRFQFVINLQREVGKTDKNLTDSASEQPVLSFQKH